MESPNGKNILALDDNPDILYTLEQICKYQGWNPFLASSFEEAGQIMQDKEIDLILVDYHMPQIDGIAAVTAIRKKLTKTPIIVLTVEERSVIMEKMMDAGATDYALKPIKAIDLISRIKVHLKYHERDQYYQSYEKGISRISLQTIENFLRNEEDFVDIDFIAERTDLKKKTVYRYLQYMVKEGRVESKYSYGDMGRPRTYYKLRT